MKVCFTGFDHPVQVSADAVSVMQVSNEALYARVCQALLSGKGEAAIEPYSIWDDAGEEISPGRAFLIVANPFELPWKHRSLLGALPTRLEAIVLEDEDLRAELQHLSAELAGAVAKIGFQFNGDYGFALEWELQNHLKAFGFGVDIPEGSSLFDNLIRFVDVAADTGVNEALLFMNLKTFLTENEQKELFRHVVFHRIKTLLLENHDAIIYSEYERKMVVDRDFIEYATTGWSVSPSLSQEGFCPNGFGAVAN